MAIIAGIDEAGLGPLLGPMVVSGVAFRVPDDHLDRCLWKTLRESCTAKVARNGRRLCVTDSKKLHRPRGGLAPLERTALVMLAVAGRQPKTWRSLLKIVARDAVEHLDRYPWYGAADLPLPASEGVGDVSTQANAVRRDCAKNRIALHGIHCEPLTVAAFNRLIDSTRNKAVVSLGMTLRVVERILRSAPGERVRLYVDRLGGRTHYREPLMTSFEATSLEILEESETRSAYRIVRSSLVCEIEFGTKGDSLHFPVALASVYSKYVRELYMRVFNEYWGREIPGIKPTAGYYTDALRWLGEAADAIKQREISQALLVRQR